MVVAAQIDKNLVELVCCIIIEGEDLFLVVREGARKKVAATGRDHVDLFAEVKLELFIALFGFLHSNLSLSE